MAHDHNVTVAEKSCVRVDWAMRQFVDDMKALLAARAALATIQRLMQERGVPLRVQQRVLVGQGEECHV